MIRAVLGVLTAASLFVAIVVVQRATPSVDQRYGPIVSRGRLGEQVDTTAFRFRVDRVQLATSIRMTDDFGFVRDPSSTSGVWVVVWATVVATREEMAVQGTRLRTPDGTEYLANSSIFSTLDKTPLQPGIPMYGPMLFEIPEDRLAGTWLAVRRHSGGARALDTLGPAIDVDLGLSAEYAARLVADAPPSLTVGQVQAL
ncbi:hypothetical protein GCM10009677_06600 [Sphaerisporangium rubeum]|uniref:DUF4352 domain-containing protein n=1 Tax=Sphaerisporangium rubeum TaxID=321317 RepID=A0A7X0IND4_9ACTN|nr:hypothetical protein [Sphaerisporangium rubeum]MBB6476907.1 hypothetical protein [Sphaerisporangium rubeum]